MRILGRADCRGVGSVGRGAAPIVGVGRRVGVDFAVAVSAPIVWVKHVWDDDWVVAPDLKPVSCTARSYGEIGQCVVTRAYGKVKDPHGGAMGIRPPVDRNGWWLKIELVNYRGTIDRCWIGRIKSQNDNVYSGVTREGLQTFTAREPLGELTQIHMNRSYFRERGKELKLGWVPSFNQFDSFGRISGNRSWIPSGGSYTFGSAGRLWTHWNILEYILARFADQGEFNGPRWWLGGQARILDDIVQVTPMRPTQTIASMLDRLITPALGLGYTVPSPSVRPGFRRTGFEVFVFASTNQERSFAGQTLPRNPAVFNVTPKTFPGYSRSQVMESGDQQFDRINVQGERIGMVATIGGDELTAGWPAADELAYKKGTGNAGDSPELHDIARKADRMRAVYSRFTVPSDWDYQDGFAAAPEIGAEGTITYGGGGFDTDHQTLNRRTVRAPLFHGVDYRTETGPVSVEDAELPEPFPGGAWIKDPEKNRYVPVDKVGFSVRTLANTLGVELSGGANHRLAKNDFGGAASSKVEPEYDWKTLYMTIAYELDQRVRLRYELISGNSPIGTELTIHVPDAELWLMAPNTVFDVDQESGVLRRSSTETIELRNDIDKLAIVMAAAINRYNLYRSRVTIVTEGLYPYGGLIGQILNVIDSGGATQFIRAPVTGIDWDFSGDRPMTIIHAGRSR